MTNTKPSQYTGREEHGSYEVTRMRKASDIQLIPNKMHTLNESYMMTKSALRPVYGHQLDLQSDKDLSKSRLWSFKLHNLGANLSWLIIYDRLVRFRDGNAVLSSHDRLVASNVPDYGLIEKGSKPQLLRRGIVVS